MFLALWSGNVYRPHVATVHLPDRDFSSLMKSELVDRAAQIIQDPPILINLVSKRVRQLNMGRPALVERKPGMREADVALQEIIEGKITAQHIEEVTE